MESAAGAGVALGAVASAPLCCCCKARKSKYRRAAAAAGVAVAVAAAVATGFVWDVTLRASGVLEAPLELADAVAALGGECEADVDAVRGELDEFRALSTASTTEAMRGLAVTFTLVVVAPPLAYAATQALTGATHYDRCSRWASVCGVGVSAGLLAATAVASSLLRDYDDDLPEDVSWLFDESSTAGLPPYLTQDLLDTLATCDADEVVARWINPGPLAHHYDKLRAAVDGALVSAGVAAGLGGVLLLSAVATLELVPSEEVPKMI